jgi:hypothetical protein
MIQHRATSQVAFFSLTSCPCVCTHPNERTNKQSNEKKNTGNLNFSYGLPHGAWHCLIFWLVGNKQTLPKTSLFRVTRQVCPRTDPFGSLNECEHVRSTLHFSHQCFRHNPPIPRFGGLNRFRRIALGVCPGSGGVGGI